MESSDVDLGFGNLTLSVRSSQTVNETSVVYLLANIPMLVATITINLWVVTVIQGKEKSRINRLIIWDCFTGVYNLCYNCVITLTHISYLSQSSHVRHVENNLSCGEISDIYRWQMGRNLTNEAKFQISIHERCGEL